VPWCVLRLARGDPEIAIFDELTAGLDTVDRHDTWSLLRPRHGVGAMTRLAIVEAKLLLRDPVGLTRPRSRSPARMCGNASSVIAAFSSSKVKATRLPVRGPWSTTGGLVPAWVAPGGPALGRFGGLEVATPRGFVAAGVAVDPGARAPQAPAAPPPPA
jgi:hypothetical protein